MYLFEGHLFLASALISLNQCAPRSDFKIIGGSNADVGEYPWMAEMYYFNMPTCAGTLISDEYVLTAAQCVDGVLPSQIRIVLGMYDIYTQREGLPETYSVSEIKMNPDYVYHTSPRNTTIAGDLAVMKLSENANLSNPFIDLASLTPGDIDFTNTECVISGWGRKEWVHPNELQEASVIMYSQADCELAYSQTTYFVRDDMICAGHQGARGGCLGDAGAPMVCPVDGLLQQTAVVSWLMPPCNVLYPTVMTSVSAYRQWITDATGI